MLPDPIVRVEEFGKWYIGTNLRRKRERKFRHLEKFEKGYKRKR